MKKGYTEIVIVLDRSSSMESVRNETILGFNKFVAEQRAVEGVAKVTLQTFSTVVHEEIYIGRNVHECPPLNHDTYVPDGWTALYDGIGRSINSLGARLKAMPESERPEHVIVVIITDGQENHSTEFTQAKIAEMIAHQKSKYAWDFVYLGANQDAFSNAAHINIAGSKTLPYASNAMGTHKAFASVANYAKSMRTYGAATFTAEDRAGQAEEGASQVGSPTV